MLQKSCNISVQNTLLSFGPTALSEMAIWFFHLMAKPDRRGEDAPFKRGVQKMRTDRRENWVVPQLLLTLPRTPFPCFRPFPILPVWDHVTLTILLPRQLPAAPAGCSQDTGCSESQSNIVPVIPLHTSARGVTKPACGH